MDAHTLLSTPGHLGRCSCSDGFWCSATERKSYRFGTFGWADVGASPCCRVAERFAIRCGLANGSTGTFPGGLLGLAGDLAHCPVVYLFIINTFIYLAFPMCQSDHFRLWHSLINREFTPFSKMNLRPWMNVCKNPDWRITINKFTC